MNNRRNIVKCFKSLFEHEANRPQKITTDAEDKIHNSWVPEDNVKLI